MKKNGMFMKAQIKGVGVHKGDAHKEISCAFPWVFLYP